MMEATPAFRALTSSHQRTVTGAAQLALHLCSIYDAPAMQQQELCPPASRMHMRLPINHENAEQGHVLNYVCRGLSCTHSAIKTSLITNL